MSHKNLVLLTVGIFGKNAFFGHFLHFQHEHLSVQKGHHIFLSTSIAFYDLMFCLGMHTNQNSVSFWTRK